MMSPKEIIQMWWRSHTDFWKAWREPPFWWSVVVSVTLVFWWSRLGN